MTCKFTSLTSIKLSRQYWPLRGQKDGESEIEEASLLAMLHYLFNFLCQSDKCSTKETWFIDSYETAVNGKTLL